MSCSCGPEETGVVALFFVRLKFSYRKGLGESKLINLAKRGRNFFAFGGHVPESRFQICPIAAHLLILLPGQRVRRVTRR